MITPDIARATAWRDHDPDPTTRAQITWLLEAAQDGMASAVEELGRAFAGPLTFGTAGLRGQIGAGESRLNEAVVLRTTAGLMAWLKKKATRAPRVVIGSDARFGSVNFAHAAARVVAAAGGEALLLPLINPTPLTSYAVRQLDADSGIMVTASHNPARDNGYKVYLGGTVATGPAAGVQLVSPADAEIQQEIAAQPFADQIPQTTEGIRQVDPREDYVRDAAGLAERGGATRAERAALRITLTPMHGVGGHLTLRALEAAGFTNVDIVEQQAIPDPFFPTVSFPNPEEPGALDLAKAYASAHGSDLIIAVDPDADRWALVIPEGEGWRQLSGDETGSILGEFAAGQAPEGAVLANSIVSSRLLSAIASAHGLGYAHTLTGFKWIGRTEGLYFGYEEAIGTCPDPAHVRDKDGMATAVLAASLFASLKARGVSGAEELDRMARTYGLYQTAPLTFRVEHLETITAGMERLRLTPPDRLAGSKVVHVVDLAHGGLGLPPQDALLFLTEDDSRVVVRPSGTEPKLKCYLEVHIPVEEFSPGKNGPTVPHDAAAHRLELVRADMCAAVGLPDPAEAK